MTKNFPLSEMHVETEPSTRRSPMNATINVPDKEFTMVAKILDSYSIFDRAGAATELEPWIKKPSNMIFILMATSKYKLLMMKDAWRELVLEKHISLTNDPGY